MKELSLHVLDVAQNSLTADAKTVTIAVTEEGGILTVSITDDGRGMAPEFLATVTDPFTTTRTTRKVGLGLPLLKLAAEQTGGRLELWSEVGRGTAVTAVFDTASIDCPPLGDMAATVALLAQGLAAEVELVYLRRTKQGEFRFDTREIRAILGPQVPLSAPEIAQWMSEYIAEGESEITVYTT